MLFKNPTDGDIPRLRELWKETFKDTDSFLDAFFETAFAKERSLAAFEQGKLIASLYIFDTLCRGEKLAYIYAVATDKNFRNKGVCRALMQKAKDYLIIKGYSGAILVPSSPELALMYSKFGYRLILEGHTLFTDQNGGKKINLREISAEQYSLIRKELMPECGVLQEGVSAVFLARNEKLYAGDSFLLAAHQEKNRLICAEFLGDTSLIPDILFTLGLLLGELKRPSVMYCPFYKNSPIPDYFGLSFE